MNLSNLLFFYNYAVSKGLNTKTSWYYAIMVLIGTRLRLDQPVIISGIRTEEEQEELWTRWFYGDSSIIVEPALDSQHTKGNAFDISGLSMQSIRVYGYIWGVWLKATWGGNFTRQDLNHFDTRTIQIS